MSIEPCLDLVTATERDLYGALTDEGVEEALAFCLARSVYRRVFLPRLTQVVVGMHESRLTQESAA